MARTFLISGLVSGSRGCRGVSVGRFLGCETWVSRTEPNWVLRFLEVHQGVDLVQPNSPGLLGVYHGRAKMKRAMERMTDTRRHEMVSMASISLSLETTVIYILYGGEFNKKKGLEND